MSRVRKITSILIAATQLLSNSRLFMWSSIFQQCNPHDKESDYWGGARGAKQGYEVSHF